MEKGRKAWFKIKKSVGINNPCNLLEKLFDSLVVPIILYGSEIWGVRNNLKDSEPFEHLQMKFIKEILGVHSKATNVACRAELARTPLKTKIQFSAIKYLEHIVSSNNTLVNKIYVNTENSNTWISTIKDWLDKLGFAHLSLNPTNIKFYLKTIEQRIYDQAIQAENSVIAESS